MPKTADLLRSLGALGIGVLGTFGVIALSLGMNGAVEKKVTEPVAVIDTMAVAAKPPSSSGDKKKRTSPTKKARKGAPSPGPLLAAGLSGLDFGLGDAADLALADATEALVGDMGGAVMDEGQVQDAPVATSRTPPSFPARARSLGQTGHVTLAFVVDVDGSVQDISVVESEPPGVFDEAAIDAVRSWEFQPGQHEGMPVAVRVRQSLAFQLE